jgi:poly-gamma-glutamate synthesis protein (capsule biosynthesis protein)
VIVTPHWGDVEKKVTVNDKEIAAGHAFIDAGATALLGTHVHIPQRCENYKNRLICYSSGNWLSKYSGQYTRIGLFYKLGLRKVNGKVVTDAFNWAPFDQGSNSKLGPVQSRSVGWLNKMFGGERALKAGTEQVDLTPAECSTYN